jgi:hypothetical protein
MNKQTHRGLEDLTVLIIGLILILISQNIGEIGLLTILVGCVLTAIPAFDIYLLTAEVSPFKKTRANRTGIAWVWAVAAISIAFMPFVYWAIGWPYDLVVTQVLSLYTFSGFMASALTAVRLIISYLLAFGLIFIVIWALVQSRTPQGYGG